MSKHTFPFSSTSLHSLRLEQDFQEWEDARRALAQRRAIVGAPLPRAPRPPPRQQRLQEVRAPPPQSRCRDAAIHNTFMYGDMKGVYAVLKDPGMVNALMETVHEEMVWIPEMGTSARDYNLLPTQTTTPLHLCSSCRSVDSDLQSEADLRAAPGCRQRTCSLRGGAAVPGSRGERRPWRLHGSPRRMRGRPSCLRADAAVSWSRS